jgi:RNA polymerase sigma factor (TIGR02999 family)
MRNLLVDHARAAACAKRGGGTLEFAVDDAPEFTTITPEDLLAVDSSLNRLAEMDPRASRIVELRFFVGLTNEEVAEVLGISEKTVKRDWSAAKSWLRTELRSRK